MSDFEVQRLRRMIASALEDLMGHRPDLAERTLDRALHSDSPLDALEVGDTLARGGHAERFRVVARTRNNGQILYALERLA